MSQTDLVLAYWVHNIFAQLCYPDGRPNLSLRRALSPMNLEQSFEGLMDAVRAVIGAAADLPHATEPSRTLSKPHTVHAPPSRVIPEPSCYRDGNPAEFVAASSEDGGRTIAWHLICSVHADGWNDEEDDSLWKAPMYPIRRTAVYF